MKWNDLVNQELNQPYFQKLVSFLKHEDSNETILPPKDQRLNALHLTPYENVKVVIIGQDPYHNHNQAHGLAFSVLNDAYPPSLKNIFIELMDDLNLSSYPQTGNLTSWANQGVLLLNTTLTVRLHQPMSHQNQGWEIFTRKIILALNQKEEPIVFILWGNHAQQFKKDLNNPNHLILKAPHPSPLSAHRGFFKSKPFSQTNTFLVSKGIKPINWEL